MAGGKASPRKDKSLKVGSGQLVNTGQILMRGISSYKAGANVKGRDPLYALCRGKVYFSHKKTSHGGMRTFVNIAPAA